MRASALGLLHGTFAANLNKLQVAQNTLARVVCQAPRSVSAMELRSRQLHWFPISQQITYKVVRCHVCLNGLFICRMEINMIRWCIAF